MDKTEVLPNIKYFVFKSLTSKDIRKELDSTVEDTSPSFPTAEKWAAEFKLVLLYRLTVFLAAEKIYMQLTCKSTTSHFLHKNK